MRSSLVAAALVAFPVLVIASPARAGGPADAAPMATDAPKNRPPRWQLTWSASREGVAAVVGRELLVELRGQDEDGDELTFAASAAPKGAVLEPPRFPYPALFRWTPTADDLGAHEVALTVSDGTRTVPALLRVKVVAAAPMAPWIPPKAAPAPTSARDWTTYMMPGLLVSTLVPADTRTWGVFGGGGVEFLIAAWIHSNENRGPSHGRVVLNLEVLRPTRQSGAALQTSLGVDLSIERNPGRSFLVPFYGLDLGVLVHRSLESSAVAHATPLVGVHLFSSRNVFLTASAGYMLPLSGRYFDELRAVRAALSADLSLW